MLLSHIDTHVTGVLVGFVVNVIVVFVKLAQAKVTREEGTSVQKVASLRLA